MPPCDPGCVETDQSGSAFLLEKRIQRVDVVGDAIVAALDIARQFEDACCGLLDPAQQYAFVQSRALQKRLMQSKTSTLAWLRVR